MKRLFLLVVGFTALLTLLVGCEGFTTSGSLDSGPGDYGGGTGPGGGLGATPGGAQDFSYIRTWIEQGLIPQAENFLVEGIFSEYDLPIEGPDPDRILTIRSANGHAAQRDLPGWGMFVQLGFSSSINANEFQRKPLNLSVVVDRSGSMRGDKIRAVQDALERLIDRLNEDDLVSIVLFNANMNVLVEPTPVVDRDGLKDLIIQISAEGSTNMDIGLRQGYDFVRDNMEEGNRSLRVFLLTDALPNTGNHAPGNFLEIVSEGAEQDIGLTAFGVGIDFDQELLNFFATQRGCNYYYLQDSEKIRTVFDEDFDFMVTPIAHSLCVTVNENDNCPLVETYGFPAPEAGRVILEVPSVFLSRRRGAILLRFASVGQNGVSMIACGDHIADVDLSYEDIDGSDYTEHFNVVYSGPDVIDGSTHFFEQLGVQKTVTLTREVITMKDACAAYHENDINTAISLLNSLVIYLRDEIDLIPDPSMEREITLVQKLIENMLGEEV